MNTIPINTEKSPNAILEIILRLKVKDAMTKNLTTATKDQTLREVQNYMKEKMISGVPIVEDKRLIGLVSVNDIINALDKGYINDKIEKHMSKNLIVLEDDMPLSFAISYFNKFKYRRFPVINKEKELVGMITSRDILSCLVNELNKEIKILENKINPNKEEVQGIIHKEFNVKKYDFENAGVASFELKKILKEINANPKIIRKASIASYELEINIVVHSVGGKIIFEIDDKKITIYAIDNGPGIEDINLALKEGYSTANEWIRSLGFGAGMGLPNVKKVSDEFDIESKIGVGTKIKSVIYLKNEN